MSTITELYQTDLQSGHITKPRWSPDGSFLALPTQSGSIAIFDFDTEHIAQTLGPDSGEVSAVTWDRNTELILTSSVDGSLNLWEPKTGKKAPVQVTGHKEAVHSVEWTDEDAFAITCSTDRIRALDGCCLIPGWTEEMEAMANKHTGFTAASCSRRTTFLLGMAAEDGELLVLASLVSGDLLGVVRMEQAIRCLAWSPVDELLAVGAGDSILLFRATQNGFEGPARELTRHASHVHALAFSGDGNVLASRDAQGVKIWDMERATLIAAHDENIETL